jgi:hypothetical protein
LRERSSVRGPQQLSGGGVEDVYVEVLNEQNHWGSGVGSSDAGVEQATAHAKRDFSVMSTMTRRCGSRLVMARSESLGRLR